MTPVCPAGSSGAPATVDVDGDGTMDLIAEFAVFDDPRRARHQADPEWTGWRSANPTNSHRPAHCRGRVGPVGKGALALRDRPESSRTFRVRALTMASCTFPSRNGRSWPLVDGSKWIGLDPATGRVTTPAIDLGFTPVRSNPVRGPRRRRRHGEFLRSSAARLLSGALDVPTLAAFSTAHGTAAVGQDADAWYRPKPAVPVRDWPLAADLDGDGRAEIVIPDHVHNPDTLGPLGWPRYGGIRMLDGATGEPRWDCPLWPEHGCGRRDGLIHLLAAPDLDADGVRDLVVVSRYSGRARRMKPRPGSRRSRVESTSMRFPARTGEDSGTGAPSSTNADTTPIGSAFWWGRGSDGWPMLALPIGGKEESGGDPDYRWLPPDPPVVHLLGAATGIEEHTVTGLTSPRVADLTGDGLADLWGAVDGKLVAIRAEPAEAWRALDGLHVAGDFDGDGVSDLLSSDFEAPPIWPLRPLDRQTALARSGRDGRLLWQTRLDAWEKRVHGTGRTREYRFMPLALPGGDLDGDGVADFVVRKWVAPPPGKTDDTLPLEALSGRTGKWLWSSAISPTVGARTLAGRDVEGIDRTRVQSRRLAGRIPDVRPLVRARSGAVAGAERVDRQCRLARISGRDGHVVWDVLLADYQGGANRPVGFIHEIADLDGSGDREIVVLLRAKAAIGASSPELRVLSLTDGQTRWVHTFDPNAVASPVFAVGDVDGNGRPDVVVSENPWAGASAVTEVTALDGRSGKPLWSWRGGAAQDEPDNVPRLQLGNFDGTGRKDVCISFGAAPGRRRVAILDAQGHERSGRDVEKGSLPGLWIADLDGDGRDELLFHDGGSLRACRRDLSELWSLPTRETVRELLPGCRDELRPWSSTHRSALTERPGARCGRSARPARS